MSGSDPVVHLKGDYIVIALAGDVDIAVRHQLLHTYDDAIALLEVPRLVVDVSRVTFMDSTGMDTLATALNTVSARGGTISVVGASARIMKLLHITDLDREVTVLPEPGFGVA
jgi:anti-sigma B factor antagonist